MVKRKESCALGVGAEDLTFFFSCDIVKFHIKTLPILLRFLVNQIEIPVRKNLMLYKVVAWQQ